MRFKLIGLICLIMQCNLSCTQHIINKETVQTLDLHRYMGKWFEIARFDHRFEHNLVGATVEYSFLPNGDIEVVNSGYWGNFSGSFKRAKGIAKITDPTCPSKLKVCFFMRFYAEYNIMEIDEDNYSYALVGSNTSDYLWLLSRTPTLPEEAILFGNYILLCTISKTIKGHITMYPFIIQSFFSFFFPFPSFLTLQERVFRKRGSRGSIFGL